MMIIVGISSVLNVIMVLTFLPLYGARCMNFKRNIFYKPLFQNLLSVLILTLISLAIRKIMHINSWLMLIVASCVTAAISIIINYFALLKKREREILKDKLKFLKGKIKI